MTGQAALPLELVELLLRMYAGLDHAKGDGRVLGYQLQSVTLDENGTASVHLNVSLPSDLSWIQVTMERPAEELLPGTNTPPGISVHLWREDDWLVPHPGAHERQP